MLTRRRASGTVRSQAGARRGDDATPATSLTMFHIRCQGSRYSANTLPAHFLFLVAAAEVKDFRDLRVFHCALRKFASWLSPLVLSSHSDMYRAAWAAVVKLMMLYILHCTWRPHRLGAKVEDCWPLHPNNLFAVDNHVADSSEPAPEFPLAESPSLPRGVK